MDTAPLARTLAEWVTQITLDDIPAPVIAIAKQHLLDAVGIAIASGSMDYGEAVHLAGTRLGASDQSSVLGFGTRMPAASAALVNGTLIHGLDFDDTHIGAIYHATAPALAAALAVGESEHADGAEVLLAYIVGLEVGCRLAGVGTAAFHARGFHPTAICGTFAAACVAGKLQGLPVPTLTNALGLCGSQAAGILEIHGSWLKRMHPGWAAHSGTTATVLAGAGFLGPATVFEGPGGLYMSHLGITPTAETIGLDHLGTRWMTTEIALKPYPCCHFTHAFADAALALLDELAADTLAAADVQSIECPTSAGLFPLVVEPVAEKTAPSTIYDALFSVQYVVARALTTRRVDVAAFYDEPLDDPAVLQMAAKVSCTVDEDSDFPLHFPGEVAITLADGQTVRRRVPASFGTPERPMSAADVHHKFVSNATRRLAADQAERIAQLVDGLEHVDDVGTLMQACVVPGAE